MDAFTERVLLAAEAAASHKRRRAEENSSISTACSASVRATPSNFDKESSIDVLESHIVRDVFTTTVLKKNIMRKDVFLYESASIFVANAAVDCTRLVLREEQTKRFVSSLNGNDKQKCVVFAIYCRILDYVECAFLDCQSSDDMTWLLDTIEKLSNAVGQLSHEKQANLAQLIKFARTAHRLASRAMQSGELEQFLTDAALVCENSFALKTTKDGAVRGLCTLVRLHGR